MSAGPNAVFLSYASQDTEAARRICTGLRSAGVEVWMDEDALRSGDAWDATIRQRIRDCRLFVPVISAGTQARAEGYFRREWRLAGERAGDIASGQAFLLPLVLDGIKEREALVPEEFLRVQWTWLPAGGELPAAFVRRVKDLVSGENAPQATAIGSAAPRSTPQNEIVAPAVASVRRHRPTGWLMLTVAVALIAVGWWVWPRGPAVGAVTVGAPAKSIAVLPFANMSDDKANAFFTDGIHEDIVTNLANVGDLKVISRTSVIQYRDSKKALRQIGEELGVAYVLEGSVRRSGNEVRVTGQLINARTDEHVWAKSYDRELKDIFSIQSELAAEIASALRAAISPGEKARIDARPTGSFAAYDLYLRAREIIRGTTSTRDMIERGQPLLEGAVQLDPQFALAWAELGLLQARVYAFMNQTPGQLGRARETIQRAARLSPDALPVLRVQQEFFRYAGESEKIGPLVARITQLYPNRAEALVAQASFAWSRKSWGEALDLYQRALELDPRGGDTIRSRNNFLFGLRRYTDVEAGNRRLAEIQPLSFSEEYQRATLAFYARGETGPAEKLLAALPTDAIRTDPNAVWPRARWLYATGDAAGVIRLWRDSGPAWRFSTVTARLDTIAVAASFLKLGQKDQAIPLLEKNREQLVAQVAAEPANITKWCDLGLIHAMLGENAEARRVVEKSREVMARKREGTENGGNQADLAMIYAWLGEKEVAFGILAKALRQPGNPPYAGVHELERGLSWWPLQADPRLEALVKDPLNNAPLP